MTEQRTLQVGIKAFLKNSEGKYLFLKRKKPYGGDTVLKWDIPGGRIIPGEPIFTGLAREIMEEAGLTLIEVKATIAAQDILRVSDKHIVRVTVIATVEDGVPTPNQEEHTDARWMSIEELKREHHDSLLDQVIDHPLLS